MATILNNSATLTYVSGNDTGSAASNVVTTNLLDSFAITADKRSANTTFRPGENITYLVTVTNTGTQPLYSVQVRDDLAAGQLSFVSGSAVIIEDGNTTAVTPVTNAPLVVPVADVLQSGESVTLVYVARVSAALGDEVESLTNTALVQALEGSTTGEVITAEPSPTATVVRGEFAQVSIEKAVDKAVISSGDTLTYTFVLENSGNIDATDVAITDTLPQGFVINSVVAESEGTTQVFTPEDYTVGADNTLVLPTSDVSITVPARDESGAGVTVVTIVGTVTG